MISKSYLENLSPELQQIYKLIYDYVICNMDYDTLSDDFQIAADCEEIFRNYAEKR